MIFLPSESPGDSDPRLVIFVILVIGRVRRLEGRVEVADGSLVERAALHEALHHPAAQQRAPLLLLRILIAAGLSLVAFWLARILKPPINCQGRSDPNFRWQDHI